MSLSLPFSLTCLVVLSGSLLNSSGLWAQAVLEQPEAASDVAEFSQTSLPLRRLTLFASGVGFFEHQGTVAGSTTITLPFKAAEVNDALKSLVIGDPASSPSVVYPSEQTLSRTLKSLSIDLSKNPSIAEILENLKGAEIEIHTPAPIRGRILGVEYQVQEDPAAVGQGVEPALSLYTGQGIRIISLKEISSFVFQDPQINTDLNRALDLIMQSRDADTRNLHIELPGEGSREVAFTYVIPTPVWKVSYRLDFSPDTPRLQGWAIVDNDSDTDWNQVQLSLVSSRPVSFIQNLYPPYRLARPVLPLAIPGIAAAQTYDSGWGGSAEAEAVHQARSFDDSSFIPAAPLRMEKASADRYQAPQSNLTGAPLETAQGQQQGEQFAFTLPKPVSLARQQSTMLPLVEAGVEAVKTLVFSGAKALQGGPLHPSLSAELTNTTGMPLPAGPITVYDRGAYGGDALIEFFPEQEKRLISYGDELSVTGYVSQRYSRVISTVTVRQGIMRINRKLIYETSYIWKNASGTVRRLILEHPITREASLTEPASFDTRTDTVYRFVQTLPEGREVSMTVKEEQTREEQIVLTQLSLPAWISYTGNEEIPEQVRSALQQAIELKQTADAAKQALANLNNQRERLISEQDRIRRNLEAVGNQSPQGQEYLKRLLSQDEAIDGLYSRLEEAEKTVQVTQAVYDTYVGSLNL
ncbi:MAG: DUF4139 domain-containing protein [Treponema sp.]|jgi:hypothetical protein|nr:DUF4139 domain-containing protein [Treponema sp.]